MSSRIKKTFFFTTPIACLFYYCDLPLGYRILKSNNTTQQMGQLICILAQTGQVFISKLASRPNLNLSQQWSQHYFKKMFEGMENFILEEVENDEDDNVDDIIELENMSQAQQNNKAKLSNSKTLLVRDPTCPQEEIYLLRCILKEQQFHKARTGTDRLWEQFQKYNKFIKKESILHQRQIIQLQQKKKQKLKQINELITVQEKKKNQLREKLTMIWREKQKKIEDLMKGREHQLQQLLYEFDKSDEDSSMMISDISNSDVVNSQDDRPLTGSLFQPSQSYFCKEEDRIVTEEES